MALKKQKLINKITSFDSGILLAEFLDLDNERQGLLILSKNI